MPGKGSAPGAALYPECGTARGAERHRKDRTVHCSGCRAYNTGRSAAWRREVYLHGPVKIPARGSQRRIRALMRIGWPMQRVEADWGLGHKTLSQVLLRRMITQEKAQVIRHIYAELAFQGAGPCGRTRLWAERRGWPGPMDWDDIDSQADLVPGYVIERDHAEALAIHREFRKMLAKRARRAERAGRAREGVAA